MLMVRTKNILKMNKELHCTTVFIVQRSCLFICSVLGTHPISCAICVSVAICINFHRKIERKKKKKKK